MEHSRKAKTLLLRTWNLNSGGRDTRTQHCCCLHASPYPIFNGHLVSTQRLVGNCWILANVGWALGADRAQSVCQRLNKVTVVLGTAITLCRDMVRTMKMEKLLKHGLITKTYHFCAITKTPTLSTTEHGKKDITQILILHFSNFRRTVCKAVSKSDDFPVIINAKPIVQTLKSNNIPWFNCRKANWTTFVQS